MKNAGCGASSRYRAGLESFDDILCNIADIILETRFWRSQWVSPLPRTLPDIWTMRHIRHCIIFSALWESSWACCPAYNIVDHRMTLSAFRATSTSREIWDLQMDFQTRLSQIPLDNFDLAIFHFIPRQQLHFVSSGEPSEMMSSANDIKMTSWHISFIPR